MNKRFAFIIFLLVQAGQAFSQSALFGREIPVAISGLTLDAMEPFISSDGNILFFNSLNSGGNTNLLYAVKVNDSIFTFSGLVAGTYDPSINHLDGVASMDTANNFFWVSLRAFPNLHRGKYSGSVTNITRTFGDFNITTQGWIIMDAAISYQGDLLYYCNAYFGPTFTECPGVPCKARLGVAQKVNDSTFNKLANTDGIFSNVNDTNYIVYAPQVTKNGLELYYTRILKSTVNSELCLSVRASATGTFGLPTVLYSNNGFVPEAASPTTDNKKIYYHQKSSGGLFRIYLRYRNDFTGIEEKDSELNLNVFPNPTRDFFQVNGSALADDATIEINSLLGHTLAKCVGCSGINISDLPNGLYLVTIKTSNKIITKKIVRE